MNVKQVLNIIHPFTNVFFETLTGRIVEMKLIDPEDLEIVKKKQVLRIVPTDYLEVKLLVNHINSAKSR